jgi:hypothetical protein
MGRLGMFLVVVALCVSGCAAAATRVARMGPLQGDHVLVTLVVTEDRQVVTRECANVLAAGPILGCQTSWTVPGSHLPVRAVKIVRYTDSIPSPLAFEIDAHELCHAIAALQAMDDPCHSGNNGAIRVGSPWVRNLR